uniref:Uncharacterized protein n=1 Tax=Oryza sativa subsp. japonica TaxID=39947 RepID=Q6YUY4_ORYSJ|nr:hypothetical protein [Oryza sativa Japonica Group]BAD16436.1 hypothetical protein [Oryza sativa Japonica Group]
MKSGGPTKDGFSTSGLYCPPPLPSGGGQAAGGGLWPGGRARWRRRASGWWPAGPCLAVDL